MIGHLSGTIIAVDPHAVTLSCGGVGYRVHVGESVLAQAHIDAPLSLWTHLAIRENSHELYGFLKNNELSFFEHLISVSGIGPKSALAILSLAPVATLASAIAEGDTRYLTKVSGIGKKTAEKIVLELRDKVTGHDGSTREHRKDSEDALAALVSLGYSEREARDALKDVSDTTLDTGDRVKEALKILGTHHG